MKTLLAGIGYLLLFAILMKYVVVAYFLLIISFVLTLYLRRNYFNLEITSNQAEIYGGFNTIVNTLLFGPAIIYSWLHNDDLYNQFKILGPDFIFAPYNTYLNVLLLIFALLIGLLNVSSGIEFPQYVTNMEADYKRRLYKAKQEEEANDIETRDKLS